MPEVKTKTQQGYSTDQYSISYCSEVIDEVKFDTEVFISPKDNEVGVQLATIAGTDIDAFDKELTELLEKYRI